MKNKEFLENLLAGDNVVENIRKNMPKLALIMPEVCDMVGFEHKHPHHIFDVWEHTLYALSQSPNSYDIRLALLLHDIGKPHSFQDGDVRHFIGHPKMSARISFDILNRLGYDKDYTDYICGVISRHDTPLTKIDIITHPELSKVIFEVQKCDALAHNPAHNKKRMAYIDATTAIFDNLDNHSIFEI